MQVIVITAPVYTEVIDDLFNTVQTGEAYEVEEFIEVQLEQLSELITRSDLDKVLSHELSLSTKPYLEGKRYLLFSSARK